MHKGMRHSTIKSHLAADANANHHKAQLVVEAVAEHLAKIVFDDGKKDREQRHDNTNSDKRICTREPASEGVDCEFRGKRA